MADFQVKVVELQIEEHPNADALELARIGDYRSVVRKGQFNSGDLAVYIPEQAVLPEWLIKALGLEGRLAGKQKNRVKAVKLRGVLSQGLVYPLELEQAVDADYNSGTETPFPIWVLEAQDEIGPKRLHVYLGMDVTDYLGIVKYEPPIPTHMAGEVFNAMGRTLKYDIENLKKYPNIIKDGEIVCVTEKIHGTWACFGYHPDFDVPIVTSKGLSARGLAFKHNEQNENNLYVRTFKKFEYALEAAKESFPGEPVYLLGEIFGRGVQDLQYGAMEPDFRLFDVYVGNPGEGGYIPAHSFTLWATEHLGVAAVPHIYTGPFDRDYIDTITNGTETVSEKATNIREGVVIKPMMERVDDEIGRVILKSVSEDYLLRKGGTEYN
jgi:RNA ligase (TIGR02306 family)